MLSIRGVATGYGKVQILRGIDMSVSWGQIVALLGGRRGVIQPQPDRSATASVQFGLTVAVSDCDVLR